MCQRSFSRYGNARQRPSSRGSGQIKEESELKQSTLNESIFSSVLKQSQRIGNQAESSEMQMVNELINPAGSKVENEVQSRRSDLVPEEDWSELNDQNEKHSVVSEFVAEQQRKNASFVPLSEIRRDPNIGRSVLAAYEKVAKYGKIGVDKDDALDRMDKAIQYRLNKQTEELAKVAEQLKKNEEERLRKEEERKNSGKKSFLFRMFERSPKEE